MVIIPIQSVWGVKDIVIDPVLPDIDCRTVNRCSTGYTMHCEYRSACLAEICWCEASGGSSGSCTSTPNTSTISTSTQSCIALCGSRSCTVSCTPQDCSTSRTDTKTETCSTSCQSQDCSTSRTETDCTSCSASCGTQECCTSCSISSTETDCTSCSASCGTQQCCRGCSVSSTETDTDTDSTSCETSTRITNGYKYYTGTKYRDMTRTRSCSTSGTECGTQPGTKYGQKCRTRPCSTPGQKCGTQSGTKYGQKCRERTCTTPGTKSGTKSGSKSCSRPCSTTCSKSCTQSGTQMCSQSGTQTVTTKCDGTYTGGTYPNCSGCSRTSDIPDRCVGSGTKSYGTCLDLGSATYGSCSCGSESCGSWSCGSCSYGSCTYGSCVYGSESCGTWGSYGSCGSYGACQWGTCSGYGSCTATGTKSCDSWGSYGSCSSYGACQWGTCSGYGACDTSGGTTTCGNWSSWSYGNWGSCQTGSSYYIVCDSGYHEENGACVPDCNTCASCGTGYSGCVNECTGTNTCKCNTVCSSVSNKSSTQSCSTSCSTSCSVDCGVNESCPSGYTCTYNADTCSGTKTGTKTGSQTCNGYYTNSACSSAGASCSGCSSWGTCGNYGSCGSYGACSAKSSSCTCSIKTQTCNTLCTATSNTTSTDSGNESCTRSCSIANGTCSYSGSTRSYTNTCNGKYTSSGCASAGASCSGCSSWTRTTTGTCSGGTISITCNAGYYLSNGACVKCDAGYYCTGNNTRTACSNKSSNSAYTSATGNTSSSCPWACNAGYYGSSANGNTSCAACGSGNFCTGGTHRQSCASVVPSSAPTPSSITSLSSGSWSDYTHGASSSDCICDWYFSDSTRVQYLNESGCSSGPAGNNYTHYDWCRTGYYAADPLNFNNWYNSCKACTNGPANSYYTSYSTPSTMYAVESNCPWSCNANYYKSGSSCAACSSVSFTDSGSESCSISNGSGTRSKSRTCYRTTSSAGSTSSSACSGSGNCGSWSYGTCYVSSCNTGYSKNSAGTACTANSYTCAAGKYLDGTSCKDCTAGYYCPGGTWTYNGGIQGRNTCPSAYPNSDSGSGAITSCYSNTKSRAWSGSQTACSKPSGCATVSCNTCSGSACDYVAYSNSAGNGDGTTKSGCSSNSAACQQTVKSVTASANYYVDGTSCSACPSGYPKSDGGNISSSKCFVVKTNTGSQTACSTPTNCATSTCGTCTPGTCDWRDYNGATDESCTPTNCQKPVASVTAKANYYVDGTSCPACSSYSSTYKLSDGGNIGSGSCYTNVTRGCTQNDGAVPSGCSSVTAWNACSCAGGTYIKYASGSTSGTTSNETCTKTVKTVSAKANYYVDGTTCPSCSSSYPKSDGGSISSSYCYVTKSKTGSQVNGSTPSGCASVTAWNSCEPGTCSYRDYNGATDESCTPENCTKTPKTVSASKNHYVHGATCPSCSSADNGTYVYSDGGDISWALCFKNVSLTGTQTPCSKPANSTSYTCGTCSPSECSYKDYAGTTDTVCTPNNCEQPVASVVCNTGYYTSGTTCPACTNAPSNSSYTGTATSNACPWSCNDGYNQTYDNQCAQMCGAGITHLHLTGGVRVPLYAASRTTPAINVKWNNTVCYGSLATGTGSGLNIKTPDGKTYHAVN